jgi:excisionase family DNA binding protein
VRDTSAGKPEIKVKPEIEGKLSAKVKVKVKDIAGLDFTGVPETADIFGYDQRTIRRRIAAGEIPATRIGAEYRIPVRWILEQAGVAVAA